MKLAFINPVTTFEVLYQSRFGEIMKEHQDLIKKQKRVLAVAGIWVCVFTVLTLLVSKGLLADERIGVPRFAFVTNQSYLDNQDPKVLKDSKFIRYWRDDLITRQDALRMRQQYQDMNREYEFRKQYGLAHQSYSLDHQARVEAFSEYLVRFIFSRQVTEGMKKAEKSSSGVRTFRAVQSQVKSVVQGSMKVEVADNFKMGTKTNLPQRTGHVWLRSDLVNGSFNVDLRTPEWDSTNVRPVNYYQEKYKLTFDRRLPVWGLTSAVSYGATTTRLATSISKQLTANLSAHFSTVRGFDTVRSGIPTKTEELFVVNYGIRF